MKNGKTRIGRVLVCLLLLLVMVFAALPPATYLTPSGLSAAHILSPVSISTCCILPLGRW